MKDDRMNGRRWMDTCIFSSFNRNGYINFPFLLYCNFCCCRRRRLYAEIEGEDANKLLLSSIHNCHDQEYEDI